MEDLTNEFIAESQERLERMELCRTELESRPEDGELVAEIFRAMHSIKGTTGFLVGNGSDLAYQRLFDLEGIEQKFSNVA